MKNKFNIIGSIISIVFGALIALIGLIKVVFLDNNTSTSAGDAVLDVLSTAFGVAIIILASIAIARRNKGAKGVQIALICLLSLIEAIAVIITIVLLCSDVSIGISLAQVGVTVLCTVAIAFEAISMNMSKKQVIDVE